MMAARTLRRRAPINQMTITVGGTPKVFDAVAIRAGMVHAGDTTTFITVVIAWRGESADELLELSTPSDVLEFPDTLSTPYVGNLSAPASFSRTTGERWFARSGEGNVDLISVGDACPASSTAHTQHSCQYIRLGVGFSADGILSWPASNTRELRIVAARTTLLAIRYFTICSQDIACSISLVDED